MPRNIGPYNPPSTEERFRGVTSAVLMLASFVGGFMMTDEKWVAAFVIAGFLYLLTTVAIVFEKVDTIDG